MFFFRIVIGITLLIGCNNQNARLMRGISESSSTNVEIDSLNVEIGSLNIVTGACSPDGSNVVVTCDGVSSNSVMCINGYFSASNIEVLALPVTCEADLTTLLGEASQDQDTMYIEIDAFDDLVTSSEAGTPSSAINVENNDVFNNACNPLTYTPGVCTNCTFNGVLPTITITPSSPGAWEFVYSATCSDGITSDSASVKGTASSPPQCIATSGASATSYNDFGDGTSTFAAWEIYNITQLADMLASGPMTANAHYILCENINMSSLSTWTGFSAFQGNFNGNNKKLFDFTGSSKGLFLSTLSAQIYDFDIENFDQTCISTGCGIIAGSANNTNFTNIHIDNTSKLVAQNNSGAFIGSSTDSVFSETTVGTVAITGSGNKIGGFVGYLKSGSLVAQTLGDIHTKASINLSLGVLSVIIGGFVGEINGTAIIDNVYSEGDILINGARSGGFIGASGVADNIQVRNSEARGNIVSSSAIIGGFVGSMLGKAAGLGGFTIENSKALGDVEGSGAQLGGFAGRVSTFSHIKTSEYKGSKVDGGTMKINSQVGGFVGLITSDSIIEGSQVKPIAGNLFLLAASNTRETGGIGGFVGISELRSEILNSTVSDMDDLVLTTFNRNIGGFVGLLKSNAIIDNSSVSGTNITAASSDSVGAFLGGNYDDFSTGYIKNSSTSFNSLACENHCGTFVGGKKIATPIPESPTIDFNTPAVLTITGCLTDCGGFFGRNF